MKCPKCGEHVILDEIADTYYCEECSVLYEREELETRVNARILFLSFLMWIPIINILILNLTSKRPVEEKQTYYNVFLSSILFSMLVTIGCSYGYLHLRDYVNSVNNRKAREAMYDVIEDLDVVEVDINSIIDRELQIREEYEIKQIEEEQSQNDFTEELLTLLDGSVISGEKVRLILGNYPEYGYLLQTTSLRTKHQNINIYLNIGRFIKECQQEDSTSIRLIDCSLNDTLTLQTDTMGYEQVNDKKTIYYIYDTEMFKIKLLKNVSGEVIGLSFTELEV